MPERVSLRMGQAFALLAPSGENVVEPEHELRAFVGVVERADTLVVVENLAREFHRWSGLLQPALAHDAPDVLRVRRSPEVIEALRLGRGQGQTVGIHRKIATTVGHQFLVLPAIGFPGLGGLGGTVAVGDAGVSFQHLPPQASLFVLRRVAASALFARPVPLATPHGVSEPNTTSPGCNGHRGRCTRTV